MVEWPEHEHHRRGFVRVRECARIRDRARCERTHCIDISPTRELDQTGHWIEQPNVVSELRQPKRVCSGGSTYIKNYRRRLWSVAEYELTTPNFFKPKRTSAEA
jgi:hypothetical protein